MKKKEKNKSHFETNIKETDMADKYTLKRVRRMDEVVLPFPDKLAWMLSTLNFMVHNQKQTL